MKNKDDIQDTQDENSEITKYFYIKAGWYSVSTNGDYIYRIDETKKLELDENGDPVGYIEKLRVQP